MRKCGTRSETNRSTMSEIWVDLVDRSTEHALWDRKFSKPFKYTLLNGQSEQLVATPYGHLVVNEQIFKIFCFRIRFFPALYNRKRGCNKCFEKRMQTTIRTMHGRDLAGLPGNRCIQKSKCAVSEWVAKASYDRMVISAHWKDLHLWGTVEW